MKIPCNIQQISISGSITFTHKVAHNNSLKAVQNFYLKLHGGKIVVTYEIISTFYIFKGTYKNYNNFHIKGITIS